MGHHAAEEEVTTASLVIGISRATGFIILMCRARVGTHLVLQLAKSSDVTIVASQATLLETAGTASQKTGSARGIPFPGETNISSSHPLNISSETTVPILPRADKRTGGQVYG